MRYALPMSTPRIITPNYERIAAGAAAMLLQESQSFVQPLPATPQGPTWQSQAIRLAAATGWVSDWSDGDTAIADMRLAVTVIPQHEITVLR